MKNIDLDSFFTADAGEFWHYLRDVIYALRSTNKKYVSIIESIEKELDEHPNLREVVDEEKVVLLSKEDIESLLRIKNLYMEQEDIEHEELFFAGNRNAFYYISRMKLFDSISNEEVKMRGFDKTFLESYSDYFCEYFSSICVDLRKSNKEYQELIKKKEAILNKYPKLRDFLENQKRDTLTKEEVQGLAEYLDIRSDQVVMEEMEIMYHGMYEAYVLFKRMNILK